MYNTLQLLLTFLSLLVRRTARSLVWRGRSGLHIASVQMRSGNLSCVSFWRQWVCSRRQAFKVLSVVFIGLLFPVSKFISLILLGQNIQKVARSMCTSRSAACLY